MYIVVTQKLMINYPIKDEYTGIDDKLSYKKQDIFYFV